jgi:PP-loop superfamily ATP-utilizing enzyme
MVNEQQVREGLRMVEELEEHIRQTRDQEIEGRLMDELAMIRVELRLALGLNPLKS